MTTEERFEKLERINRRWRVVAMALGLVVVTGLLMAQGGSSPDVIKTRRLEVVNKKGVPVITLQAAERGGQISTTNADGKLFFEVGSGELSIYDDRGKKLVRLSATKEGQGMMATYNNKGEGVIALGSTKDGKGALTTYNGAGQKQVTLSGSETGGVISVWNNSGQAVSTIRTDEYGDGEVGAWNSSGKGRKLTPGQQ